MKPDEVEAGTAALQRDARQRSLAIGVIAGIGLVAVGAALVYAGATFEEPAERLATRSVPMFAPIALVIGGVVMGCAGLVFLIRGVRRR